VTLAVAGSHIAAFLDSRLTHVPRGSTDPQREAPAPGASGAECSTDGTCIYFHYRWVLCHFLFNQISLNIIPLFTALVSCMPQVPCHRPGIHDNSANSPGEIPAGFLRECDSRLRRPAAPEIDKAVVPGRCRVPFQDHHATAATIGHAQSGHSLAKGGAPFPSPNCASLGGDR
jgi:hypothetical protein